jgi:anti-anti-sigma factor
LKLKIETKTVAGIDFLIVSGKLVFHNRDLLVEAAKKLTASSPSTKLLVDLSNVAHIDSSGMTALTTIYKLETAKKGKFGLIVHDWEMENVLARVGFNRIFPIFDGEETAIKSI